MIQIKTVSAEDYQILYNYTMGFSFPYMFFPPYAVWKESMLQDTDGEGRSLFQTLHTLAAYDENCVVGYIQYGHTAFGFDESGGISDQIHYPVIRMAYFDEGREDAGSLLIRTALESLGGAERVYAFFHYFGLSCFARHGKLFEKFAYIEKTLMEHGFTVEHENVYYSSKIQAFALSEITMEWGPLTSGGQQSGRFILDGKAVGECEVHYLEDGSTAYLRWIYIEKALQNAGLGSKCMAKLKQVLQEKGIIRLDTDTAMQNSRAQHFYEKNAFIREGVTRSYYKDQQIAAE